MPFHALALVPKNLLSYCCGAMFRVRRPRWLVLAGCRFFARLYALDMKEAELPLSAYGSLEELFTRRLRPGARPVSREPCAPADGRLVVSRRPEADEALQAKGLTYSLRELVFGDAAGPAPTRFGWYTTIYLAPHNYHRVHAPVGGRLRDIRYFPGQLWPVNERFVGIVPSLFVRNERLVFEFELDTGGIVWAVMVGALNVGRMTTRFWDGLVTNDLGRQLGAKPRACPMVPPRPVAAGDEIGVFNLGSTVVLVFDEAATDALALGPVPPRDVRMGQFLGS
jgi:phosphatidylserine decarboxylase